MSFAMTFELKGHVLSNEIFSHYQCLKLQALFLRSTTCFCERKKEGKEKWAGRSKRGEEKGKKRKE